MNAPDHPRIAAYLATIAAALAAPSVGRADIIFSGPININIPSTSSGIYLNLITGQFSANPALVPGWDLNPWGTSSLNFFSPMPNPGGGSMLGSGSTYANCRCGQFVGPGANFGNTGSVMVDPATPLNFNSSNNYMGFRFLNKLTGQINYGWLQISLSGSAAGQPRAIVAYLYDNSGASVTIGPLTCVPEPTAVALIGLLATGAVGLRWWRRRQGDVSDQKSRF